MTTLSIIVCAVSVHRILPLLSALALLGACGSDPGGPPESGGGGLAAVATVFPLAWLTSEIAPSADVTFLGARGQDPHDLELSPGDREAIETADVLVTMGDLDFQPQVEAAAGSAGGAVVEVAAIAGEARLLGFDESAHDDDHDDEGDDHDEGDIDPHVWFDAALMAEVAEEIGAAFASADPDHAEEYEANAGRLAEELRALHEAIDEQLSGCRHDTAIVSHDAYGYLLEPRGLHQEGISGSSGHSEASPQRLAELTERIRRQDIPAVAAEPFEGRADAETLAREAGVELVEIDPLEAVTDEEFAVGYPALLRQQADAFAVVLGCE